MPSARSRLLTCSRSFSTTEGESVDFYGGQFILFFSSDESDSWPILSFFYDRRISKVSWTSTTFQYDTRLSHSHSSHRARLPHFCGGHASGPIAWSRRLKCPAYRTSQLSPSRPLGAGGLLLVRSTMLEEAAHAHSHGSAVSAASAVPAAALELITHPTNWAVGALVGLLAVLAVLTRRRRHGISDRGDDADSAKEEVDSIHALQLCSPLVLS